MSKGRARAAGREFFRVSEKGIPFREGGGELPVRENAQVKYGISSWHENNYGLCESFIRIIISIKTAALRK